MAEKKILNYQDLWHSKMVRVDELLLDPLNIRLEKQNWTQEEIINDLFVNEDAMQILKNIYENGYYPDEPPVVVQEKKKFYVIDGNRRIVSLKAMLKPGIAPDNFANRVRKMMKNFTPISKIEVRIATNREDAQKYLAAKHTKNTRRPWTALRRAYFYYAQKYTGFTANEDGRSEGTYSKYASLDDKTDGFHFYLAYIKFGIGRCTSDASHEIRDGHITREEGVSLVKRYDGEFPKKYFKDFLEYLDITEDHFWRITDAYRPPHLWKKVGGEWELRRTVWGDNGNQ